MQFTTIALTFVAAVAAINPAAKEAFVANYIANAKRQATNGTASASASASVSGGAAVAPANTGVPKATTLPASTSDATVMALSGSALLAGVMALVL